MPWIRMMLRGTKVLARCDDRGHLRETGSRVEVRYRPEDGRAYLASMRNLERLAGAEPLPDDHCAPGIARIASDDAVIRTRKKEHSAAGRRPTSGVKPAAPPNALIVYADGACSGNPGPAGLGVVAVDGEEQRELSEYLGEATNNIAELTAIMRAAEVVREHEHERPVRIYTDSSYSIGVLSKGWKAKANVQLVAHAKAALSKLADVELVYVPGHAGVPLNERADELARQAVSQRASTGWCDAPPGGRCARP